jgi:hypothetical protein|tara:strand:- start:300 stop:446 length:147 start_codon:yes stop_codon:yes gene_type:complete
MVRIIWSLSLLAGAIPDALAASSPALDASSLFQKFGPLPNVWSALAVT